MSFLCIGTTLAFFQMRGTLHRLRDMLKSLHNGLAISFPPSFRNLGDISSGPNALFVSRILSWSLTSWSVTIMCSRPCSKIFSSGGRVALASSIVEAVRKNLLKASALLLSSVKVSPSISKGGIFSRRSPDFWTCFIRDHHFLLELLSLAKYEYLFCSYSSFVWLSVLTYWLRASLNFSKAWIVLTFFAYLCALIFFLKSCLKILLNHGLSSGRTITSLFGIVSFAMFTSFWVHSSVA